MSELTCKIEKVGFQGDGITADGLFVPLTLPGEEVRVRADKDHAKLLEVLTPSPERVEAACKHFTVCGGCSLQHWDLLPYSQWKQETLEVLLSRAGLETEVRPILTTPPGTRRRVGLHAKQFKGAKGIVRTELGYKLRRSWDQVRIEECPIADPIIVAAIPVLTEIASHLFEHPKSAPILSVTVSQTGLDIDIRGVERTKSGGLSAQARMEIAMIAQTSDLARISLSDEILYQVRLPAVRFGRAMVELPTGSFLQASPKSEADMVGLVKAAVSGAKSVADLFCGAGTFTFPLAETASVYAADTAGGALKSLKAAIGRTPGLKPITAEVRDLFRAPVVAEEMAGFDAIVFDPPRAGAEAQAGQIARSKAGRVVGISCNPQTFARDAKILTAAGFKLEHVTPIDQFLWSGHVELVGVFSR
ncbi:class I SAM-dependent RNA methyltransferase [Asticcacaulis sp. BYS171W]|uniref:Class I SAM-dependent RNA methyltransferase n=1 Tax=Asticcacaulis aquaticus TaxID=2984212 RepID=A0ABT5HW96_9CAUL|nr:class I SAM-dependent RNA methyltransferase [Asticcacaulis aquaticus]MDC7684318.1 class I SAM-dependent RNA methyltransferase [Asticcacaulis aquaticus]